MAQAKGSSRDQRAVISFARRKPDLVVGVVESEETLEVLRKARLVSRQRLEHAERNLSGIRRPSPSASRQKALRGHQDHSVEGAPTHNDDSDENLER